MIKLIFLGMIELFLFFSIGAILAKYKIMKESFVADLSSFITKLMYPAYIFYTIVNGLDTSKLNSYILLPFIGAFSMIIGAIIGIIAILPFRNTKYETRQTFKALCCASNYGFLPIILVNYIYKEPGLAYLFIVHLGCHIVFWTVGVAFLGDKGIKNKLKNILSPNIIAIILAIIIKLLDIDKFIPDVIFSVTQKIGIGTVPLICITIGANLFFSERLKKSDILFLSYFTFIRNIILPLIFIGLLSIFNLPQDIYNILVIVAIMPSSSMMSLLTKSIGGDASFASKALLLTHLFGLITIPLGLYLFMVH